MTSAPAPLGEPTYVSRPLLPALADYQAALAPVWDSKILTNLGPAQLSLEQGIRDRVGFGHVTLWNNGTVALLAALSQLDLTGEVIVTPFTFPATVHAIAMLGLTPVFADVDPVTMTIAPESIAERITPATTAIVGTHIYGVMCDTQAIGAIAHAHGLRVIYDGAHSFARKQPVFEQSDHVLGDVTMLSFHATKLFHTVEGGALITPHASLDARFRQARNFGIRNEDVVEGIGMNGKLSEPHSVMGLLTLGMIDGEIDRRAEVAAVYSARLAGIPGLSIVAGEIDSKQYFVIRVDAEAFGRSRDELHAELRALNIISRKYFYPLCSDIDVYADHPSAADLPHARAAADECLALPFYGDLPAESVATICDAILWHSPAMAAAR